MLPSPDLFQADSRLFFFPTAPRRRRSFLRRSQRRRSSSSSEQQQRLRRNSNETSIVVLNATSVEASASVSLCPSVFLPRGPLARVPVPAGVLGLGAAQLAYHLWSRGAQGAAEAGRGGLCGETLGRQQRRRRRRRSRRRRRRCSSRLSSSFSSSILFLSSFFGTPCRYCVYAVSVCPERRRER